MRAVALIEAPAAAWRGRTSASTRGARARGPRPSFASSDVGETSETFSSDDLVQVGAVVGAHSLRGEVRVKPMTDFVEERFMTTGAALRVELAPQGKSTKSGEFDAPIGDVREVKVRSGRWVTSKGRNDVIVKLAGCDDRNAAEELIGTRLYILPSDRTPLRDGENDENDDGDDEFYAQELEGLRVIDQATGNEVGTVADIVRGAGTQDLLKVEFVALDEETGIDADFYVYVPFVKEIVPLVDTKGGFMEITPPTGLLELKTPKKNKKQRLAAKARMEKAKNSTN